MTVFVDRKFLKLLSPKLKRFSQKKEDLFNFRCPFCGDSQKNQSKARGYVYRRKADYFYKCQNCGVGHNMFNFINSIDTELAKEYSLENYRQKVDVDDNLEFKFETPIFEEKKYTIDLPKIEELTSEHYARAYCENRKIPESNYSHLYFSHDFKSFVLSVKSDYSKELKDDDPRLIIPFFSEKNELYGFQGRALRDSKLRYITIKLDESVPKLFGLNKVNKYETIFVTEGPIDSLFLENAVATADSNLMKAADYLPKDKLILVFDNEPRNKEICELMNKAIDNHFKVCIWPEMIVEKDINEMILSGYTSDELKDIIEKNTYNNLRAKLEFLNWRKS